MVLHVPLEQMTKEPQVTPADIRVRPLLSGTGIQEQWQDAFIESILHGWLQFAFEILAPKLRPASR